MKGTVPGAPVLHVDQDGPRMKKAPVLHMNVGERVTWDWLQTK